MTKRTTLVEKLTSKRNTRINERFAARARVRALLNGELTPRLRGARDALADEPIHTATARERIERVLERMAEECARLDTEDEADRKRTQPTPEDV